MPLPNFGLTLDQFRPLDHYFVNVLILIFIENDCVTRIDPSTLIMADNNHPGGSKRGTGLKFQPKKIVRRSEAERQAAEQQLEQERARAAAAAAAALPPKSDFTSQRGRPIRGRGRGRGGFGTDRASVREGAGPLSGPSPAYSTLR